MQKKLIYASLKKFHRDEAGLEALQVVMILAVAAIALIAVKNQWGKISAWFEKVMEEAIGHKNWSTK